MSSFGQGQVVTSVTGSFLGRALWIGAGLPETSIRCFLVSPLTEFLATDFLQSKALNIGN
jgi:hypothetical protein